jgi:uncharacterized metal-binding protein
MHEQEIIADALKRYDEPEIQQFAKQASIQEGECYANRDKKPYVMYPTKPRVEEIIEFAQKMGFKKLGVAFCGGVTHEASILVDLLQRHSFEMVAVSCKVGAVPKERIGLRDDQKIRIGEFEPMCNPICQAEILNAAETDMNIMMCLCVGHDSLFLKYAKGFNTVFAVKDRVTGHNPMAVLYNCHSYYQRFKKLVLGSDEEIKSRLVAKK